MDVAVLADAPTLTTGFGGTTRRVADGLVAAGYSVACFGLKATSADVDADDPVLVWPAEQGGHWTETLRSFFEAARPRVLFLNMDVFNAVECIEAVRSAGWAGRIVSYAIFDGLPVTASYLDAQRSCDMVLTSSVCAARYLAGEGVEVVAVAPPGVDLAEFRPRPTEAATDPGESIWDAHQVRRRMGLRGDGVLVGIFGTNTERKQAPRALAALPAVQRRLGDTPLSVYLHCSPRGFWPLGEMAGDIAIDGDVAFAGPSFDEYRGVPLVDSEPRNGGTRSDATRDTHGGESRDVGGHHDDGPSYVDRLRACDVVVNVPHSGDVEQVILEAQACGVPLVHTDDRGVMTEAVGEGGILVPGRDQGVGRTGQVIHHVSPDDVAAALGDVLTDASLRDKLRERGITNAARYGWDRLRQAAVDAVAPFVPAGTNTTVDEETVTGGTSGSGAGDRPAVRSARTPAALSSDRDGREGVGHA